MEHAQGPELWLSHEAVTALERESPDVVSSIQWIQTEECFLQGIHVDGVPLKQRLWRAA